MDGSFTARLLHRFFAFGSIEPNELEQTPVIDPVKIDEGTTKMLADLFDELRKTARHGNDSDPVLDRIDTILNREL